MDHRTKKELSLLRAVATMPQDKSLVVTDGSEELSMLIAWKRTGIFDGRSGKSPGGVTFLGASLTPAGRALLAELSQKEEESSSLGIIKKHRWGFYKWMFGIIGSLISAIIIWLIKKNN